MNVLDCERCVDVHVLALEKRGSESFSGRLIPRVASVDKVNLDVGPKCRYGRRTF